MTTVITALIASFTQLLVVFVPLYLTNRKKDKQKDDALMMLLQSQLTNIYFAYDKLGEIPDYMYKNWKNMLKEYEGFGGDDYIHALDERMDSWIITHTGIIK